MFPTKAAARRAKALQQAVRENGEEGSAGFFDQNDVDRATVHGREDLVLIYSMLVDVHRQSVNVSRGVWAIFWLGLVVALAIAGNT